MKGEIATIINYCTNDFRFLKLCIEEASRFSSQIIVPVCDHFFDGTEENRNLLNHSYEQNQNAEFIEFAYDLDQPYGIHPTVKKDDKDWAHYWHSTSRYVGYHFVRPEIESVLFIDVDEIPDGIRMRKWLEQFNYGEYEAIRFTSYFYFREARFQAKKIIRNPLLMKKSAIEAELLLDLHERKGSFLSVKGAKLEDVSGLDGMPLFHHYSWVKTKEEMLKKVLSWGHRHDKNWEELIEKEFSHEFNGIDSLYGIEYQERKPFCDPLRVEIPTCTAKGNFDNVRYIDRKSLFKYQFSHD